MRYAGLIRPRLHKNLTHYDQMYQAVIWWLSKRKIEFLRDFRARFSDHFGPLCRGPIWLRVRPNYSVNLGRAILFGRTRVGSYIGRATRGSKSLGTTLTIWLELAWALLKTQRPPNEKTLPPPKTEPWKLANESCSCSTLMYENIPAALKQVKMHFKVDAEVCVQSLRYMLYV